MNQFINPGHPRFAAILAKHLSITLHIVGGVEARVLFILQNGTFFIREFWKNLLLHKLNGERGCCVADNHQQSWSQSL